MSKYLLTILPLFLAQAAFAGPSQADHTARMNQHLDKACSVMHASTDQCDTARTLLMETAPQLFELRQDGRALHEEMANLFIQETVDRSAVETVRLQAIDLFDETTSTVLDTMVNVANLFSVEQRTDLQTFHNDRREQMRAHIEAMRSSH